MATTSVVGCALCGYQPHGSKIDSELRMLGTAPVSLMVCADHAQCVTRYAQGQRAGTVDDSAKRSKLRRIRT
jgi:hypothetical protein